MNKIEIDYKKTLKLVIIAIIAYWILNHYQIVLSLLSKLLSVLMPFIIGCMIAFVLNVLMIRIEKQLSKVIVNPKLKILKRVLSILGSIALVVGVVAIIIILIIPELVSAIKVIALSLPEVIDNLQNWTDSHSIYLPQLENLINQIDVESLGNELSKFAKTEFSGVLDSTIDILAVIVNGIVNFVLGLVFAIYILMSKETLKDQTKRLINAYLPSKVADNIFEVARLSRTTFSNFIIGQTVEAFILGALCTIGMIILGLPYAPMVGSLVGITAFIPIIGAFIGGAIGAFMIFTVDYMQAFIFIIFLVILQQLEGDLIYPRVVGSTIGLPSIWVLFAVTVGGSLWGITGVLLGVPIVSVIYSLVKIQVKNREKRLKVKENVEVIE
ncbi:AI-2E family transporter [Erysipelatoclostridium sp. An15]|uniref:AI-2E family transporter n=1 Tax=Erysipelatoclostridium sp. An15 TaxID=1965566 RepID=UPI000B396208|nr:AI-2E family transporter [Erysipelatoclostridium sp. An15]OUQ07301.1 AI-2E family transporter [Erysipelatoclostridium sp. An15]